jgi:sortase (surface protein transpeptidase)
VVLAFGGLAELTRADGGSGPPRPTANVVGKLPPMIGTGTGTGTGAGAGAGTGTGTGTGKSAKAVTNALAPMPYSAPTHIAVPAVNLDADVISVDLNADGSIGTPSLANAKVAGWYDRGPAPGQPGAAVLDAHVDSSLMSDYRGAFFYLGLAEPGMTINVTRADHSLAVFSIDAVQVAQKSDFPTAQVYAPTPYPSLRLITCGGDYDKKAHEYLGNTIVYAHLTAEKAGRKALGE